MSYEKGDRDRADPCKIYVGGNPEMEEDELRGLFAKHGTVEKVWIARSPPGFAFVWLTDERDVADAIKALEAAGGYLCSPEEVAQVKDALWKNGKLNRHIIAKDPDIFAEACGLQLSIDLDAVERPDGVEEQAWLTCFPSFGYLLAVDPARTPTLVRMLRSDPDLICCCIGGFSAGACRVLLQRSGASDCLWEGESGLTGFGCAG